MARGHEVIIQKLDDGRAGYIVFENAMYTYFEFADTLPEAREAARKMARKYGLTVREKKPRRKR